MGGSRRVSALDDVRCGSRCSLFGVFGVQPRQSRGVLQKGAWPPLGLLWGVRETFVVCPVSGGRVLPGYAGLNGAVGSKRSLAGRVGIGRGARGRCCGGPGRGPGLATALACGGVACFTDGLRECERKCAGRRFQARWVLLVVAVGSGLSGVSGRMGRLEKKERFVVRGGAGGLGQFGQCAAPPLLVLPTGLDSSVSVFAPRADRRVCQSWGSGFLENPARTPRAAAAGGPGVRNLRAPGPRATPRDPPANPHTGFPWRATRVLFSVVAVPGFCPTSGTF